MRKRKTKRSNQARRTNISSFVTLIRVILGIFVVALVASVIISSTQQSNTLGTTSYLAKDDGGGGDSGGSSGGGGSSGSSGSGSSGTSGTSGSSEPTPIKTETRDRETGIRTQTETKEDETRTEVRLSETERIRTRTKDGQTRVDITSGGIKTRLEQRDNRIIIKAEREDGTEVELEDDTIFKIDDRLDKSGIKIATIGAQRFVVQRGTIGAVTNFPLSIDLATNELFINTPAGQRSVTVLPEQAVQNILAANIVNKIGGLALVEEVRSGAVSDLSEVITLGERNGIAVYEITGISDQKLLGFIPVAIQKTVVISAQTGEVITEQEPLGTRLVDLLSF